MPLALLAALAGSLAVHLAALFGPEVELFGESTEVVTLQAELKPMPQTPASAPPAAVRKPAPRKVSAKPVPSDEPDTVMAASPAVPETTEPAPEPIPAIAPEMPSTAPEPVKAILAATGVIRFAIYKTSLGLQIGIAEHRWEFAEDGSYRLTGVTETSGLVALFKPVRMEYRSVGRLTAHGLQPDNFRTLKNGQETRENADFDWSTAAVRLARDDSVREIAPGTQDILSLNYQLGYLKEPEAGSSIGVVTGKKYERYALDALGEEEIDTPAGHFRTLRLRAATDSVTEIWIALDRHRLPVKIRFTDKKGDSYEQIATELGTE